MSFAPRTPAEAVEHLGSLGTGVRASVVVGPSGAVAAHSDDDAARGEEMGQLLSQLFERADASGSTAVEQLEVSTPGGVVFGVRRSGWSIGVVADRLSLSSLMLFDLQGALAGLSATRP